MSGVLIQLVTNLIGTLRENYTLFAIKNNVTKGYSKARNNSLTFSIERDTIVISVITMSELCL